MSVIISFGTFVATIALLLFVPYILTRHRGNLENSYMEQYFSELTED